MDNGKKFLSDVDILQKARDTKKLVIFVGAGVSINSGMPSWNDMLNNIKLDIGIDNNDTEDALQVAQIYFNERKQKEYIERIRTILHHKKKKYNPINTAIFDLQPEHVVTTNYDDLLEQVIKKKALPFSVVKKDSDFPYSANSSLLVKIHGDLDDEQFVLKEDDYLNYEFDHPLFEAFIKSVFSTKVVLFVGYSFSDINLKIILQKVRNILGQNFQNSYLVTHGSFSNYKVNYLREKGVNVLSYEENKSRIDDYLNGTNAKNSVFKKSAESLSSIGENLLSILTFINKYDRFREDLSSENYVHQMKVSLERFSEMNVLPYYFIANLYPFNDTNKPIYYDEQDSYSLKVTNINLINFLAENTKIEAEGDYTYTVFKESYIETLHDKGQTFTLKKDLEYLIKTLNFSVINEISPIRYDSKIKSPLLYDGRDKRCDCFTCLIDRLKIAQLIDKINITNVTDESDVQSDSQLAYAHYKIGNIYNSYNLFEEIARKAWHTGKYVIYFIAQFNIKKLGHIIHWTEYQSLTPESINELSTKSNSIDLESVYRQINDVSKEESELIKIVRDNEFMKRANKYVLSQYEKIRQLRVDTERGSNTDWRNPGISVEFHLVTVDTFYKRNFIVNDIFSESIDFFNLGIKALLLNYANYRDFSDREYTLSYMFCSYFLSYGRFSELQSIINELNIIDVQLTEKDTDKLYNNILNYYLSFISGVDAFGEHKPNHKIRFQIEKNSFNDKFTDIFDNISLLLGIVDIGETNFRNIFDHLLSIIRDTDFLYPINISNLEYLFIGGKKYITSTQLNELLDTLCQKTNYIREDIIKYVFYILKDRPDEDKISNEKLIVNLLNILDDKSKEDKHLEETYIYYVHEMVDIAHKGLLKEKAARHLQSDFTVNQYWLYVMNNVVDYDMNFERYLERVIEVCNVDKELGKSLYDYTYTFKSKKQYIFKGVNYEFINFIRLAYRFNLLPNDSISERFCNKKDYMNFFLNPESFDYEKFDIEWLLYTKAHYVHEKLSKNEKVKSNIKLFVKTHRNEDYLDLFVKYYMD